MSRYLRLLILVLCSHSGLCAEDVVLINDFEDSTYGDWKIEGTAFGPGPAKGTLPGQMHVDGYRGERLVNSFCNGDDATGTLTSPPIEVTHDYFSFLIGGGGYPEQTCINLLLNGQVIRSAVGPNLQPGGSETLATAYWDVRELKGERVTIQIVDRATGGWGHINVDHIIQTNDQPKANEYRQLEKSFVVKSKYLVLPIKNGAQATEVVLEVEGNAVRRYGAELATHSEDVDWYAFLTIESYAGRAAKVTVARGTEDAFALVRQSDTIPGADDFYTEALRPQFHFSQKVGWNNDPNGMVYLDGQWHLFFQHNPVGWNWGNMTWGHAISKDLVHWEQLPNVLFPKTMAKGDCFSGGGTVDTKNTSGWKVGDDDVLVVFLTDTGAGESVAFSNDGGRSFQWYKGNPVVKHRGRDPKVIWYAYGDDDEPLSDRARELGGHWVMAVFDEHDQFDKNIAFYTSVNLKEWTEQSHLTGYYECPELFKLPVDGKSTNSRWVIFAGDARYAIGDFDGRTFSPEHEGKHQLHWGKYYASQTFENVPNGRRIQMGWVQIAAPGMPFNQTFSFPHELTLRRTEDGIRMYAEPIKEIEILHKQKWTARLQPLAPDIPVGVDVRGELFDIRATLTLDDAQRVGLDIGGNRLVYDVVTGSLGDVPLAPMDGCIRLHVLVDRSMIEICGNDGRVFITSERETKGPINVIQAFSEGGHARLSELEIYELKSIWNNHP